MENAGTVIIDNLENYLNGFSLRNFKTHVDPEQLKELSATQAKVLHHLWQPKSGDMVMNQGGSIMPCPIWIEPDWAEFTKNRFTWLPNIGDMINILDSFNPYSLIIEKSKITHKCLIPIGTEEWCVRQQGVRQQGVRPIYGSDEDLAIVLSGRARASDEHAQLCDVLWELVKCQLEGYEIKLAAKVSQEQSIKNNNGQEC